MEFISSSSNFVQNDINGNINMIGSSMLLANNNVNNMQSIIDSKAAGRWTAEEHKLFLQGLQLHNKQWKLIADLVKTRTVVQIRTHAQKYFQKLEKVSVRKNSDLSTLSNDLDYIPSGGVQLSSAGNSVTMLHSSSSNNNLNGQSSSRNISISSADSTDSQLSGATTSEGESDTEVVRSPRASFDHTIMTGASAVQLQMNGFDPSINCGNIPLPMESPSNPRKRSRDSGSKPSKSKKVIPTANTTKKNQHTFSNNTHNLQYNCNGNSGLHDFDDFMFEEDVSFTQLMEIMEQQPNSEELEHVLSRANSPFTHSASAVASGISVSFQNIHSSSDMAPTAPEGQFVAPPPTPVLSNKSLSHAHTPANNSSVTAVHNRTFFAAPTPVTISTTSDNSSQARTAFTNVLSEFKQLIQHVTQRQHSHSHSHANSTVASNSTQSEGASNSHNNHCPVLPSLKALAIMSSAGMQVSFPDTLTPLSPNLCHYPIVDNQQQQQQGDAADMDAHNLSLFDEDLPASVTALSNTNPHSSNSSGLSMLIRATPSLDTDNSDTQSNSSKNSSNNEQEAEQEEPAQETEAIISRIGLYTSNNPSTYTFTQQAKKRGRPRKRENSININGMNSLSLGIGMNSVNSSSSAATSAATSAASTPIQSYNSSINNNAANYSSYAIDTSNNSYSYLQQYNQTFQYPATSNNNNSANINTASVYNYNLQIHTQPQPQQDYSQCQNTHSNAIVIPSHYHLDKLDFDVELLDF